MVSVQILIQTHAVRILKNCLNYNPNKKGKPFILILQKLPLATFRDTSPDCKWRNRWV